MTDLFLFYLLICICVEGFVEVLQVWNNNFYDFTIGTLFTPTWFKSMTYMNKYGCYFCAFLCALVMPIGTIYRIFYWLFHL